MGMIMKMQSSQKKGRDFEIEIARDIRRAGLDKGAKRMKRSGAIYGMEGDVFTGLPVSLECKCQEKTHFTEWYEQSLNRNRSKMPVVVWKQGIGIPFVYFQWSDFLELLSWAIKGGMTDRLMFPKGGR